MISEAVDSATAIAWALLAWIAAFAAVVTVAVWSCIGAVWAACAAVAGALAASGAVRALGEQPERDRPPQRPSRVAA